MKMRSVRPDSLKPTDKWLLKKENGKCIVDFLCNIPRSKVAIEDISAFKKLGSDAKTTMEIALSLNQSFIALKLPLIAEPYENNKIVITRTKVFDIHNYDRSDREKALTEEYKNLLKQAYDSRRLPKVLLTSIENSHSTSEIDYKPIPPVIENKEKMTEEEKQRKLEKERKAMEDSRGTRRRG
jgi:predicted phage tail protein